MSFIYGGGEGEKRDSSNNYANGDNQNCGNVITGRPSIRMHHAPGGASQISFGNDAPEQHYQQQSRGPPQGYDAPPPRPAGMGAPAGGEAAPADYYKKLMLPELRTFCRERGLNPGGGKEQLHERLTEAINAGACAPVMIAQKQEFDDNLSANNHARPDGQNTGNFLTDRNSSRVLAPPGGASQICFGDASPPRAHSRQHSRQRDEDLQANRGNITKGHDIFGEENNQPRSQGGHRGVRKDPGGGSSLVLG